MALDFTDIYQAREFVEELKKKHIDIDDQPLQMGIFGYLGDIHSNIIQNSAQTAAENALEGLPTKAKYTRNLYTHAYSVGLSVNATPASIEVCLVIPEAAIEENMDYKNIFTLDKDSKIEIGDYEFHLEYDIMIRKTILPNGEIVYSAQYDLSSSDNPFSNITNPYIQSIGRYQAEITNVIMLYTTLRQYHYEDIEEIIYTSNPLQNKSFTFNFQDQLAGFNIDVIEGDNTYHLKSIYDGLIDTSGNNYITYQFIQTDTIRCTFKKESYQPRMNCRVHSHVYTTKGSEGNFQFKDIVNTTINSSRFHYNNIWLLVQPVSDSVNGENMKSSVDLRKAIPKEMLARGTVTNSKDLENFFNSINTSTRKIYFIKKLDSIERLYYSYVSIKDDNENIIPTNTIDISMIRPNFDTVQNHNYILYPGNCIYYRRNDPGSVITSYLNDEEIMSNYRKNGYLYMNPFLMIINKNPFYVSYLINIIDTYRTLNFSYINQNSPLQFIANEISWKREFFTDRDTYKLSLTIVPNIQNTGEVGTIYVKDPLNETTIIDVKIKVIVVLKGLDGVTPYRYIHAKFDGMDNRGIKFLAEFTTDNMMDDNMNLKLKQLYDINQTYKVDGYFPATTNMDIYICPLLDEDYGGKAEAGFYDPDLVGYTCSNKYSVIDGVPLYYDYSTVISTFINVEQGENNNLEYYIKKVPVVKYDYVNTEERIQTVLNQFELIKSYIEYKLQTIEDGFGIDIKLFNTYGPAKFFMVDDGTYLDNVSLSLKWKTKLLPSANDNIINDIIKYIKDYIENFDTIGDLHIPNLQADVTKAFSEEIAYFEYLGVNDYGLSVQHLYRTEFEEDITKVPELLAINIANDKSIDIDIIVSNL